MANKNNLSPHEMEIIKRNEAGMSQTLRVLQEVTQFKVGDFLIAFHRNHWEGNRQVTNSYGAPKKFTVVHVDSNGIPYMKELNKKGEPTGIIIASVRLEGGYSQLKEGEYRFEVDPDYTDSIIMQDEENYDATLVHRMKGDLFKEITAHNKSIKIKTNDTPTLINFLQNLKVGDVIWKSIKTNLTVIELQPIPLTHRGTRLAEYTVFGKVRDSKGKEHELDNMFFRWGAFYTAQPRSYNELKDPK